MNRQLLLLLVLALSFAACSPAASNAPAPTLTLIPAQETVTFTPVPPTQTPLPLPAPGDLAATPSATPETLESESTAEVNASLEEFLRTDPIAAELVALAQRLVADQLDLPVRRVRVVDVQAITWSDTSLGCPIPDQIYQPAAVDGYRIVLTTGDAFHVYHTDFDRVIPCTADTEQLPGGAEATAEVTVAP
jgi:hypothetical protein